MLEKIQAGWRVFRAGEKIADATGGKILQAQANDIAALLVAVVALLKLFGVDLGLSAEQIGMLAGGLVVVLGLVNKLLTAATTDKIGIAFWGAKPAAPASTGSPATDALRPSQNSAGGDGRGAGQPNPAADAAGPAAPTVARLPVDADPIPEPRAAGGDALSEFERARDQTGG